MKYLMETGAALLMAGVPGRVIVVHRYSLSLLLVLGALLLDTAGGSALASSSSSSSSSPSLFAEDIIQLAQPAYHFELESFGGGSRHLLQTTSQPILLATNRTDRPNVRHGLKKYRGGYNLSDINYGFSLGYTGLPAWIIGLVWAALGLLLLLTLCCCCCCCRHRTRHEYNHGRLGYILPILALIAFTLAAIAGSVLLYYYSQHFRNELRSTLDTVVNQSQITENGLREVQSNLTSAANVDLRGFFSLTAAQKAQIATLNQQLESNANDLHNKTWDNRHKIINGINIVRIVLFVVAGVMLALVLLGLLFSALGVRPLVYLLILLGWILVIGTWILCGIFIFLDNGVGDTCLAMQEWVNNAPEANTSLDKFLPCNPSAALAALQNTGQYSSDIVTNVNNVTDNQINQDPPVTNTAIWYNQSGPAVPTLCNTTICASNTVPIANAPTVWRSYICSNTDPTGLVCQSQGRLTPFLYGNLTSAANTAGSLTNSGVFLSNTANCKFVSDVFTEVNQNRCGPLRKQTKWIWIGLILVSAGSMLSILLWIVFIRRKRYRYYQRKNQEKGMYNGQSQPYSPNQPRVSPAA